MKRFLRVFIALLFVAVVVPSCELLEDCATCRLATYENGSFVSATTGILYCGDALAEKESAPPTTIGNTTTQWECE